MRKIFTLFFLTLLMPLPLLLLTNSTANAQAKNITGKVTGADDGIPLAGVSVKVKGTNSGATTDVSGNFKLTLTADHPVLMISYIGYLTQEIPVGDRTVVNVSLAPDSRQLQEVVVSTALGITRQKRSLGYAAQGVQSEELNFNRQPNLLNALQGKVAGATISSVGGGPGQGANIKIRGINSIDPTASSDPLYVIDGVQIDNTTSLLGAGSGANVRSVGNRASDVNPEDTINILKGGAATALYGLRGANGVIVITTKKGKTNGVRVNFTSSYGVDNPDKLPAIQQEYTAGILGVYTPIGLGPAWGPTIAEAKLIDPTHPDFLYNNYERAFETGTQIRNSVNLAGGTDAVKFFSSVSSFFQDGMLPFTDYKNLSARLNTDITISSKVKAGINMNFTNSGGYSYDADRFGESLTYFSGRWDVKDYLNPDGTQLWRGTNNPIYGAATNRLKGNVNRFIGGANLDYTPFKWLNFSYRAGIDMYNDYRFRTAPGKLGIPGESVYDNADGFVGEYNTDYRAVNTTFLTTLTSELAKDLNGTLRLGYELYDKHLKDVGVLGSVLGIYNDYRLTNAKVLTPTQNINDYRSNGFFGEASIKLVVNTS